MYDGTKWKGARPVRPAPFALCEGVCVLGMHLCGETRHTLGVPQAYQQLTAQVSGHAFSSRA